MEVQVTESYLQHPNNRDRVSCANISTVTVNKKGQWISHTPDFIIFPKSEVQEKKPRPGSKCSFCKDELAILMLVKLTNSATDESAGYRYCRSCFVMFN
jgi:hypothetical protein